MTSGDVDIDEVACAIVMRRYGLNSTVAAVNLALRRLAAEATVQDPVVGTCESAPVAASHDVRAGGPVSAEDLRRFETQFVDLNHDEVMRHAWR